MRLRSVGDKKVVFDLEESEILINAVNGKIYDYEEIFVSEGITTITSNVFGSFPHLKIVHFPQTLCKLEGGIFQGFEEMKVFYNGTSLEFIEIVKPVKNPDAISSNAFEPTFDSGCKDIEVYCTQDDTYIYYGSLNKKPQDPMPLSREGKEERKREKEAEMLYPYKMVYFFCKEADVFSVITYGESKRIFPCLGNICMHNDKLYIAVHSCDTLKQELEYSSVISLTASQGCKWLGVTATVKYEEKKELISVVKEQLPVLNENGYELFYIDSLILRKYIDQKGREFML